MYNLNSLAERLYDIEYVVLRNWKDLPDSLGESGHEDLDLFVTEGDRGKLMQVLTEFDQRDKVDVWGPNDGYFPQTIAQYITRISRLFEGFKIPSKVFYFESLYYHNAVHKEDSPYDKELKRAFLDAYPPMMCTDKGVGHYV